MPKSGEPVYCDLSTTPLAGVTIDADVEAAVAQRTSDYEVEIAIYRRDPKDEATPINVDRYRVYERFPNSLDFSHVINVASTCDNENMRGFLADHVFLGRKERGPDHWIATLPPEVVAVVRRISNGPAP